MLIIQATLSLQTLLAHQAMLPAAGGVFAGLTFALFRSPVRPFGIRESESLMNFSSLGTLRCICGPGHPASIKSDRRQFCRSCGCEIAAVDETLLHRKVSKAEARKMTRELRDAAIRASHLELPPSVTSVTALQQYLSGDAKQSKRTMPKRQPAVIAESTHLR